MRPGHRSSCGKVNGILSYPRLTPFNRRHSVASAAKVTTTLSTKGQVILPVEIRRRRHWDAGTRLVVEDTPDGVLLKPAPLFPPTLPEQVFGSLPHKGPPKTLDEMRTGIEAEVRRQHGRGRY